LDEQPVNRNVRPANFLLGFAHNKDELLPVLHASGCPRVVNECVSRTDELILGTGESCRSLGIIRVR